MWLLNLFQLIRSTSTHSKVMYHSFTNVYIAPFPKFFDIANFQWLLYTVWVPEQSSTNHIPIFCMYQLYTLLEKNPLVFFWCGKSFSLRFWSWFLDISGIQSTWSLLHNRCVWTFANIYTEIYKYCSKYQSFLLKRCMPLLLQCELRGSKFLKYGTLWDSS